MAIGVPGTIEAREAVAEPAFLGPRMVGIAFVAQLIGSAVTLSAFGNFVTPLAEAFSVSPGIVGLGVPIAILLMGLLGPLVGRTIDRGLARRAMTLGAVVTGLGLLALGQARTLGQALAIYALVVCGGAAFFSMMPSMALVANWYVKRRGLALGVAIAGATLASYLAPASAEFLIQRLEWSGAVAVFGVVTLVVCVPLFGLLTVGRPEEVGQRPDGERRPEEDEDGASSPSGAPPVDTGTLARDARLWLVAVGFGLVLTSPVVLLPTLVPFGKRLGFSGQEANLFFLAMIPFSLLGKLAIGALADVLPPKRSIVFIVVLNVLVWGIFTLEPALPVFVATGALYGLGVGGSAPLQGVVIGLCFGRANFGRAHGLGGLVAVPLLAAAGATSSLLLDATGGYHTGFAVQMGLIGLGGLLLLFVPIPRSEDEAFVRTQQAAALRP